MWFRQDLRLQDNPALADAVAHGEVLPVFILDDENAGSWRRGAASRWWLHHSLSALDRALDGKLWILRGNALELLPQLASEQKASLVTWNRCYEPWRIKRDTALKESLKRSNIQARSHNGSLLFEPGRVVKPDGSPYKVFTPFYKQALTLLPSLHATLAKPELVGCAQPADKLAALRLLPTLDWAGGMETTWTPGEAGAHAQLERFLEQGLGQYKTGRDFPAQRSVSRLSPHLHFGEIAPQRVLSNVERAAHTDGAEREAEHFLRELIWREFSYSLLLHFPRVVDTNLRSMFDAFPWRTDGEQLRLWQQGKTGFPIVDAGMRELWQTGYMHNRVRMIVASFLVKNLMMHWSEGARWFWDCLVDADLANNSCGWQWVAGSGADAAPYFRIFNPVTQSEKFDPTATYIKQYVPELAALPARYCHAPAAAPTAELTRAGVKLGDTYPMPMVDLQATRARALDAFKSLPKQDQSIR